MSSCGYSVSEYASKVSYLLAYREKLRMELHKVSSIFSEKVLQVVYGFVSSFQFQELK